MAKLRDPEIRRRILVGEDAEDADPRIAVVITLIANGLHKIFPLGDPPDYEPGPEKSVAGDRGARRAATPSRCSTT